MAETGDDDGRLQPLLETWLAELDGGGDKDLLALAGGDAALAARVRDITDAHPGIVRLLRARPADEPSEPVPAAPERIGDFRILRRLGAGGMGTVYLARQESLRRLVAVKVLDGARFRDPRARLRLRREAEILAALDHPGIVPVYAVGEEDEVPYLAMKCLSGPSLDLAGVPLPPEEVAALGAQVARALDTVHLAGIVHRDIKPANILLDDGCPVLVDFGLARGITDDSLTVTGTVPGTLAYLAPEQLSAGGRAGPGADIHALGATLYELAAGAPPFTGEDPERLVRAILTEDPPRLRLPKAHRGLEAVILRALDKDPARRFATAADLAADLERHLRGEPVSTRPAGASHRLLRRARRHPKTAAGIAAAFLALAVLGIVSLAFAASAREVRARALDSSRRAVAEGEYGWAVSLLTPHIAGSGPGDEASRLWHEARAGAALDGLLEEILARPESIHAPSIRAALQEVDEAAAGGMMPRMSALARAIAGWHLGDDAIARSCLEEARRHGGDGPAAAAVRRLLDGERTAEALEDVPVASGADEWSMAAAAFLLLETPFATMLGALDAAERADPGHRRVRFLRAIVLDRSGRLREALAGLQDLARGPASSRVLRLHLARLKIRLGRLDDAEKDLHAIRGGRRNPVDLALQLAIWSRRGENARAEEILAAWRDDPEWRDDATILRLAGEMAWMRGRTGEARELLQQSLDRADTGIAGDLTLASLLKVRDAELGDAGIPPDPGAIEDGVRRANLELVASGREMLRRMRHPGSRAVAHWIVARACARVGEVLRAWRELGLALEIQPSMVEARLEAGALAYDLLKIRGDPPWAASGASWAEALAAGGDPPASGNGSPDGETGRRRLVLLHATIIGTGRRRLGEVLEEHREGSIALSDLQLPVAEFGLTFLAAVPVPDSEALAAVLPGVLKEMAEIPGGDRYELMRGDLEAVRRFVATEPPWSGRDRELVPALASER